MAAPRAYHGAAALTTSSGGADVAGQTFFKQVRAEAILCGVSRLADVTGLDRIGLPVWQAVRPAGRSLSVHQGKGASSVGAQISALCEAIEAHCAETVEADGPACGFADLPPSQRAPEIGDYCKRRDAVPTRGQQIRWCIGSDLLTGESHYLPHAFVSLDYTEGLPTVFERSSGGLGAGATQAAALQTSLLEVLERDAVGEWRRLPRPARAETAIEVEAIPFDWFHFWRDRLATLGIGLNVFEATGLASIPVLMCIIGGPEEFGPAFRRFHGTAAHGDPEVALFKALAEAIQSRLTLIAGVRDDILPSYYATRDAPLGRASRAGSGRVWSRIEPSSASVDEIANRLSALGYRQIVFKRLDREQSSVAVTKAFVPGLGSLRRSRRACP